MDKFWLYTQKVRSIFFVPLDIQCNIKLLCKKEKCLFFVHDQQQHLSTGHCEFDHIRRWHHARWCAGCHYKSHCALKLCLVSYDPILIVCRHNY
jgi:hypothetical protein